MDIIQRAWQGALLDYIALYGKNAYQLQVACIEATLFPQRVFQVRT